MSEQYRDLPEQTSGALAPGLYRTPFSRAWWHDAAQELKSVRMLCIAAILIAVRVALKTVAIPILPPTIYLNLGFFVNALGAGIFGPLVALLAAAVSDTVGALLTPNQGVYFFPFIIPEMAGSLIFALCLYRQPRTNLRVILSRFLVCFLVNIVIQSPIMLWYYQVILGKSYALFDLPRICKNLVFFPIESLLLIFFFNLIDPVTYRLKLTYEPPRKKNISAKTVALVLALLVVGSAATAGYYVYDYNTRNHTNDFEGTERADFNRSLALELGADDGTLVLVNTIYTKLTDSAETVTYSVYSVNETEGESSDSLADNSLWGLLNSAAAKKENLTFEHKYTVELDKKTLTPLGEPTEVG